MTDTRIKKLARVLVDHSAEVQPGDRVAIETTTNAEVLVREVYELVLQRGGHPHLLLNMPEQDKLFFKYASEAQLDFTPTFPKLVADQFEVSIRIRADVDTRSLKDVAPERQSRWQKAQSPVRNSMLRRGGDKTLRWVLTQFPTEAYAREAGMNFADYEAFVYGACHADDKTEDPVAYWQQIREQQKKMIARIEGHDKVKLMGPNVDLSLSIKGRKFNNSHGRHNMPDGEIYTGPVENSVSGWVKFTYPAVYQGRVVEGVELTFEKGRVATATAEKDQDFLLAMLDSDVGARYLGEFAIGTNFEINRFTRNILFDEKLGGTFHIAMGAGYPETGSLNTSVIHWDMICDMRGGAEIQVDGDVIYKDGAFRI